jgi:hypothetical protein
LYDEGGSSLRPDFILRPLAGVTYDANIVELKLSQQPIIKASGHGGLYARIHEAVDQLRACARYFESEENQAYVEHKLGFTPLVPKLTLIVGRTIERDTRNVAAQALQRIQPVELRTYTDLLVRYRSQAE